jgi:hypothetical protein
MAGRVTVQYNDDDIRKLIEADIKKKFPTYDVTATSYSTQVKQDLKFESWHNGKVTITAELHPYEVREE